MENKVFILFYLFFILKRIDKLARGQIKAGKFFYRPILKGSRQMLWYLYVTYPRYPLSPSVSLMKGSQKDNLGL
jgi:hypothetical protein